MSNHLHVVLRVRPDLVQTWTDEEIAFRWRHLYAPRNRATGRPSEPEEHDLAMITSNPARVTELRARLASLSWFMRCLSEPIARAANREDQCKGRFWEGRFKSQALLDEAAVLACSVYVDLNPIRAGIVDSPEKAEFTSAFDRIQTLRAARSGSASTATAREDEPACSEPSDGVLSGEQRRSDAWLCELTLQEGPSGQPDAVPATGEVATRVVGCTEGDASRRGRSRPKLAPRASDQGYLPIDLEKYLSLLDWTGRALRAQMQNQATIPGELPPILQQFGLNGAAWVATARHFGRWFKRAVGRGDSLTAMAVRAGRRWLQGRRAAKLAFS
jgi:hypothetical protein